MRYSATTIIVLLIIVVGVSLGIVAIDAPVVRADIELENRYPTLRGIEITADTTPANFMRWVYLFSLVLGAFLAVLVISWGGFRYIASFGNAGQQSDAKRWITDAMIGVALLLIAIAALRLIDPNLVNLRDPDLRPLQDIGISEVEPEEDDPRRQVSACTQQQEGSSILKVVSCFDDIVPPPQCNERCGQFEGGECTVVTANNCP